MLIQRLNNLRNREGGFTLVELLIVIAIIGIIAAILIPNLLDALQKARQKRTVADVRNMGTAWFSWLTDAASASAAGGGTTSKVKWSGIGVDYTYASITGDLVPQYIQTLPQQDGWKNNYQYRRNTSSFFGTDIMGIRSMGRDGKESKSGSYTVGPFDASDYDQDIVWADGFMVHYPGGKTSTGN